jgi:hypothetical protein
MARLRGKWALTVMAAALAVVPVACGGDDEGAVEVTLQEWEVNPSSSSVDAGEVSFDITNGGGEVHEFVVLQTDLGIDELPTAPDGSLDEEGGPIEVVDEVEDIPAGESESLDVELDSGSYVLACNIVEEEDGETESHFENGMATEFTAE